jgi:hypothetical protein
MVMRPRHAALACLAASSLTAAPLFAEPPPPAAAPAAPPAAAPAAAPAPKHAAPKHAAKKADKAEEPALPAPEIRMRVIAPSTLGPWLLRIDNEGSHWLRIPADARLLRLTVQDGDTMSKKRPKAVTCTAPAALRPAGFPEREALLIGPGQSYVEAFDPRLFCFGKAASELEGGAVVQAKLGWEAPKHRPVGKKKTADEGPFAVEGTEFPATVAPLRELVAPTMVLPYTAIDHDELEEAPVPALPPPKADKDAKPDGKGDTPADAAAKAGKTEPPKSDKPDAPKSDKPDAPKSDKPGEKPPGAEPPVRDENAPKLELTSTAMIDAALGNRVNVTITATNVGHRPTSALLRPRMVAFRIEGPLASGRGSSTPYPTVDGDPVPPAITRCDARPPTNSIPREAFRTLKPGASMSLTLIVSEVCAPDVFRRPGLYKLTPTFHANESGASVGVTAYTGVVPAVAPTLVRVHAGPAPFHSRPPRAIKTPPLDEPAPAPKPDEPAPAPQPDEP